jgi:hypothetical protein
MSNAELFQRHPRMSLRPEQHFHIAAAYDKAAFDISLPLTPERSLLKKQTGFVCLLALEKRKSKLHSRNNKPQPQPNPFGFIAARH